MAANNGSDENDFVNIIISLSLVSLSLVTRLEPPNPIRFNLILSVPIHCIHCIHCSILNLSISDFSGFWKSTHDHHRNCKCIKLKIIIFQKNAVHHPSSDGLRFPTIDQGFKLPAKFTTFILLQSEDQRITLLLQKLSLQIKVVENKAEMNSLIN